MLFRYKHMDPSVKESLTEELSLPQKRVDHQPENFDDVSEPRDSYMGARETYKHDNSPNRQVGTPIESQQIFTPPS